MRNVRIATKYCFLICLALDQDNNGSLDRVEAAIFFGRLYDEWYNTAGKKDKNKVGHAQQRQEKVSIIIIINFIFL